jgi:hypothetical protein
MVSLKEVFPLSRNAVIPLVHELMVGTEAGTASAARAFVGGNRGSLAVDLTPIPLGVFWARPGLIGPIRSIAWIANKLGRPIAMFVALMIVEAFLFHSYFPSGKRWDGFLQGSGFAVLWLGMSFISQNHLSLAIAFSSWGLAIFLSVVTDNLLFVEVIRFAAHVTVLGMVGACWMSPSKWNEQFGADFRDRPNRVFVGLVMVTCALFTRSNIVSLPLPSKPWFTLYFPIIAGLIGAFIAVGPNISSFLSKSRREELQHRDSARESVAKQLEALQIGLVGRWKVGSPDVPPPAPASLQV